MGGSHLLIGSSDSLWDSSMNQISQPQSRSISTLSSPTQIRQSSHYAPNRPPSRRACSSFNDSAKTRSLTRSFGTKQKQKRRGRGRGSAHRGGRGRGG
eukprot:361209_1